MRSADSAHDAAAIWDIATPARPGLLPGVSMAGFRARTTEFVDLSVIPFPAVTVLVSLGDEPLTVDDINGRQQNGSVVVGLVPSGLRGRGRDIESLQVRLSPVIAHAVLGVSSELSGMTVSLDDLWGRDAARTQEQLRAARSWDDRFAIAEAAFVRRHEAGRTIDPEVAFVWRQMVTNLGGVRVERLAGEVGWSRKRLWSRFRAQIGLNPKRAAQLVRFDHAAHRLAAGHSAARGGGGDRLRRPVPPPSGCHGVRRCDTHGRRGCAMACGRRRGVGRPRIPVQALTRRSVPDRLHPAGATRGRRRAGHGGTFLQAARQVSL